MHLIHININSLLPKIDEVRYIESITNASIIGINETKLDVSVVKWIRGRWLWFSKSRSIKERRRIVFSRFFDFRGNLGNVVFPRLHSLQKSDCSSVGEVAMLLLTLKVWLLESVFVKVTFICLNQSQSYWVSYIAHPINQILSDTLIMFSQKLEF